MIAALRRFYRRNCLPVAKAELLNLLDENPTVSRAVLLIELLPLAGIRNIYLWEDLGGVGHLIIRELNSKVKTERTISSRDLSENEFSTVMRRVEEGMSLGNYSGKAMDGVSYSLCWGSRQSVNTLNISNPQVGSKGHLEFVDMLKRLASEGGNK